MGVAVVSRVFIHKSELAPAGNMERIMYPGVIMCFPDGVTYSKGYVKDLDEAKSYITLDDKVPSS